MYRHDPGSVSQPERGDAGTQLRVCAISGIHQDDAPRQARVACGDDLVESDHGLCLEDDVFRNAGFLPARRIVGPVLREIETLLSIAGATIAATLARTISSDQGDCPTKCSSD